MFQIFSARKEQLTEGERELTELTEDETYKLREQLKDPIFVKKKQSYRTMHFLTIYVLITKNLANLFALVYLQKRST